MPYERTLENEDLPVVANQLACVHFRSKAMYVTGQLNPNHIDEGAGSHQDDCWCNVTQHIIGPDKEGVHLPQCTTGRTCFKETY